jgi:hypothetical protein
MRSTSPIWRLAPVFGQLGSWNEKTKPGDIKLEVVLGRGRRIGIRPGFDAGTLRDLNSFSSKWFA